MTTDGKKQETFKPTVQAKRVKHDLFIDSSSFNSLIKMIPAPYLNNINCKRETNFIVDFAKKRKWWETIRQLNLRALAFFVLTCQ